MSADTTRPVEPPAPAPAAHAAARGSGPAPYLQSADLVLAGVGSDATAGLSATEAAARLRAYGQNAITGERPPSLWAIALVQVRDPMNLMLLAVTAISLVIGQVHTAVVVGLLVVLNVVLGARQELKARESVDALAKMQVPQTRALRDHSLTMVPAVDLVPGDIIQVEAGDIIPADARILVSATLETQEAALTGESAPVSKDAGALTGPDVALGDRSNMLFQNTSVTRGTATAVITATGMQTQMGQIASMLTSVKRKKSPLQRELDQLTKVLGIIAWSAVAVIVIVALFRGVPFSQVMLLGTAMAISAIPTGMPTFVSALLSYGAKQLAAAKAVVKNLSDVETLGATSVINSDKTGTLTLNQMMVSTLYMAGGEIGATPGELRASLRSGPHPPVARADDTGATPGELRASLRSGPHPPVARAGTWFTVGGEGYKKQGEIRSVAGIPTPDFTRLALGLCLASDATVSDDGVVVGDPTEAALVVLAAKLGIDAEETRRAYPRLAEVPFDSEYKFMATFHRVAHEGTDFLIELVKGAPDVVLARCSQAGGPLSDTQAPMAQARADAEAANQRMGGKGLRVLAFAVRVLAVDDEPIMRSDPMALTRDLAFVGMVGIIDPLRPEAKAAVTTALSAGIDVRMITGDHAVTAQAIGESLGLGPGAISGAELQALSDTELKRRLPELHVFGRVSPEDKLRLARVMQEEGFIVAMTGDAVNDAAALKQADIGVAMGSGSEVTKQAGRIILTDDNFGTLVHAVELGRAVYDKIVAYIRFQMTQLLSLIFLFVAATIFNINNGVAMSPSMALYVNFFVLVFAVIVIAVDPPDPDLMSHPPRDPKVPITNRRSVIRWTAYGFLRFLVAFLPLVAGPGPLYTDRPSAAMTMTFVVMCLTTVFAALVMRRDPSSGLLPPILKATLILAIPVLLVVLSTELKFMQDGLLTQPLTGPQWLVCIGLSLITPVVVEVDKWISRRRGRRAPALSVGSAVSPARALIASAGGR